MKKLIIALVALSSVSAFANCGVVKTIMAEDYKQEGIYRFYLEDGNTSGVVRDPLFLELIKESWKSKIKICFSKHSFGNSELVYSIERAQK